jgi:3-hydroxyacyl-CoA dehydrogenase/3a,7a,12a-trihydroxy-5b-cholest-24-enoyl-CoA hydratase
MMAAQKLDFLQKIDPADVAAAAAARAGGAAPAAAAAAPEPAESPAIDVFLGMGVYVEQHPELIERVGKTYLFKLSEPDSAWILDVKNAPGGVTCGEGKADCTFEMSEADFLGMASGEADAQKMYFSGKLKIGGDAMAAQKLDFMSSVDAAEVAEGVAAARAAGKHLAGGAVEGPQAVAPSLFAALGARLVEDPALAGDVGARIVFQITDLERAWTADLSGGASAGAVSEGAADNSDLVISLDDDALADLAGGAAVRDLFQRGRVRLDGDIAVAHRLHFLSGLV